MSFFCRNGGIVKMWAFPPHPPTLSGSVACRIVSRVPCAPRLSSGLSSRAQPLRIPRRADPFPTPPYPEWLRRRVDDADEVYARASLCLRLASRSEVTYACYHVCLPILFPANFFPYIANIYFVNVAIGMKI